MKNVLQQTLTPGEFIESVCFRNLKPQTLSPYGDIATRRMRDYYNVSCHEDVSLEVIIGGVRKSIITISEPARMWSELINIGLAKLRQGKSFIEVISLIMEQSFGHYLLDEKNQNAGISALFDQVYYLLLHYDMYKPSDTLH